MTLAIEVIDLYLEESAFRGLHDVLMHHNYFRGRHFADVEGKMQIHYYHPEHQKVSIMPGSGEWTHERGSIKSTGNGHADLNKHLMFLHRGNK